MESILNYLLQKRVPMMRQTIGENTGWFKVRITKTGKFFRANGKIISRNAAIEVMRVGLGEIKGGA